MRAENDHDLVDAARAHALEDGLEQEALLRRAEPRRGPCCENDGGDQGVSGSEGASASGR